MCRGCDLGFAIVVGVSYVKLLPKEFILGRKKRFEILYHGLVILEGSMGFASHPNGLIKSLHLARQQLVIVVSSHVDVI